MRYPIPTAAPALKSDFVRPLSLNSQRKWMASNSSAAAGTSVEPSKENCREIGLAQQIASATIAADEPKVE